MAIEWTFRESDPSDAAWMAELRAEVLRPDLERLGRFDTVRVRRRFLDAFVAEHTRVIRVGRDDVGLVAVRPEPDALWLEHFYLAPHVQGRGIGSVVLEVLLGEARDERPLRLNVLQGSPARGLYERFGFAVEREDAVDVFMTAARQDGPRRTAPIPRASASRLADPSAR